MSKPSKAVIREFIYYIVLLLFVQFISLLSQKRAAVFIFVPAIFPLELASKEQKTGSHPCLRNLLAFFAQNEREARGRRDHRDTLCSGTALESASERATICIKMNCFVRFSDNAFLKDFFPKLCLSSDFMKIFSSPPSSARFCFTCMATLYPSTAIPNDRRTENIKGKARTSEESKNVIKNNKKLLGKN